MPVLSDVIIACAMPSVPPPESAVCIAAPRGARAPGMPLTKLDTAVMPCVSIGVMADTTCEPTPTTAAWRLPSAPSMVLVEVAASTATSCIPSFCTAAKELIGGEISPFSMASRKLPSKAPASRMAS